MSSTRILVLTILSSLLSALLLLAQGRGGGGTPPTPDIVGLTPSSYQLKVMGADGSNLRTVSNQNFLFTYPTLSPDGQQIAFAQMRGDVSAVWVIRVDGTGLRAVTSLMEPAWGASGGIPFRPAWSPVPIGGQHKLLFTDRVGSIYHLFVVNLDGSGRTQLTGAEPYGVEPYLTCEWSPNATRIVYTTYDPAWPGATLVAELTESGGTLVIASRTALPLHGIRPYWVALANRSDQLVVGDSGGLGYDLWRIDLSTSTLPVPLTSTPSIEERYPSFSSDDNKVFFSPTAHETWELNADGSGSPRRVTTKLFWCYHRRG